MTIRHPYFSKFETSTKSPDYQLDLNLELLGQDVRLVGKQVTSVPYGPIPGISLLTNIEANTYLIGKDSLPIGKQRLEVPISPITNPYWILSTNPNLFTSVVLTPNVSQRTENPLLPSSNPFWINFLNPPAFPSVSVRTEVPYGPPPNPFWTSYLTPLYNFPKVSQVYFVPVGPPPNSSYQSFIIPAGQDKLPKNQYSWPVPIGPTPGQSFVQSYSNPLNFVSGPIPFNQYKWPNPNIIPIGIPDWQDFTVNIPQPPPPPSGPVGSGRYITEREVQEALHKLYNHRPDKNTVHTIAQALGKQGGIKSGISRRGR